jgi:hypothetical protein
MTAIRATILGLATLLGAGVGLAHAAPGGLKACLDECKRARLSDTNRASCRLDCETEDSTDPEVIQAQIDRQTPDRPTTATGKTTASAAAGPGCQAACDADRTLSVDDRASCKLDCDLDPDSPVNLTSKPQLTTPPPRGSSPLTFQLTGPPPSEAAQASFLDRCHATCQRGPYKLSPTDFATCKLDCKTMASVLDVASGWMPPAFMSAPAKATPPPTRVATHAPPVSPTPATTTPPRASGTDRSAVAICGDELSACNDRCSASVQKCERGCGRKHVIETDRETCKLTCETNTEACQGDCLGANATCVNGRQPGPR